MTLEELLELSTDGIGEWGTKKYTRIAAEKILEDVRHFLIEKDWPEVLGRCAVAVGIGVGVGVGVDVGVRVGIHSATVWRCDLDGSFNEYLLPSFMQTRVPIEHCSTRKVLRYAAVIPASVDALHDLATLVLFESALTEHKVHKFCAVIAGRAQPTASYYKRLNLAKAKLTEARMKEELIRCAER